MTRGHEHSDPRSRAMQASTTASTIGLKYNASFQQTMLRIKDPAVSVAFSVLFPSPDEMASCSRA